MQDCEQVRVRTPADHICAGDDRAQRFEHLDVTRIEAAFPVDVDECLEEGRIEPPNQPLECGEVLVGCDEDSMHRQELRIVAWWLVRLRGL